MKQKIYNIGINLLIALFVFISVILPIFGPPIRRWIQDSNKSPEQIARETHERLMKNDDYAFGYDDGYEDGYLDGIDEVLSMLEHHGEEDTLNYYS